MDYRSEAPDYLKGFLTYLDTVKGKSPKTVNEYYLDLRLFFRYLLWDGAPDKGSKDINETDISGLSIEFVKRITITDIYSFLIYLNRDRPKYKNRKEFGVGLEAPARARKTVAIRSYFKYMTDHAHLLEENPAAMLELPKKKKSLPAHLTLSESRELLEAADGAYQIRDYCMLTLFLNCGLRVSELVGLDINDIREDSMIVTGKGNKERIVYLNDACLEAIDAYIAVRESPLPSDKNALFISYRKKRIGVRAVQAMVEKRIRAAGLDTSRYSVHKLRHTAATLMYQNGVDVRTLQEILGHENLDTTRIYTHVDNAQMRAAVAANPLAGVRPARKPAPVPQPVDDEEGDN